MASRAAAFHHGLLGRRDLRRHLKHHLPRPRVHILHLRKRGEMRRRGHVDCEGRRLRTSPSSSNWMAQCVPGTSWRSSPSAPAAGSGSGGGSSTAGNTPALRSACSCTTSEHSSAFQCLDDLVLARKVAHRERRDVLDEVERHGVRCAQLHPTSHTFHEHASIGKHQTQRCAPRGRAAAHAGRG